jgi:hypothetical protein
LRLRLLLFPARRRGIAEQAPRPSVVPVLAASLRRVNRAKAHLLCAIGVAGEQECSAELRQHREADRRDLRGFCSVSRRERASRSARL